MKSVFKRITALIFVVMMLSALIMLASCDAYKSTIESFIKSDNYTVESESYILTVDGASVNFKMDDTQTYLYYDKQAKSYYYVTMQEDDESIVKLAIDSEQYISYYKSIVSPASTMAAVLSGFKHVYNSYEEADGKYTFKENDETSYFVSVSDGTINFSVDNEGDTNDYSYKAYNIGETKVTIPDNVKNAEVMD
jgi:hypothetical protein